MTKRWFRGWLLWLSLLGLGALSACRPAPAPTLPPSSTPAPGGEVRATDALGRPVRLPRPPQRIVVAGRAGLLLADALYAFPTAPQQVVALPRARQGMDFLTLVDPDLPSKASLSPESSVEAIAAYHPDLVLMKAFLAPKLGAAVEASGLPVFYLSLENPQTYPQELAQLGALLGQPERGQELAAYYLNKTGAVREAVHGAPPPRTLVLQHSAKGGETAYLVPPASWIQTEMVRLAGGTPLWATQVAGSSWTPVGLEQIVAWNPEQIFLIDYFASPAEAAEALRAQWGPALAAPIHPFPKDDLSWDQPDPRWVLGLLWMAKHLHPDRLQGMDLNAEVNAFYRTLYGLDEKRLSILWERLAEHGGLK